MTTETRRAISLAASAPRRSLWADSAACTGVDREQFFSDSQRTQRAVRSHCCSCPVVEQCLADAMARETGCDRWGVLGGLTPAQRLALSWETRLHGRQPDIEAARMLISPQWRYELHVMKNNLTPDSMVRRLRAKGLVVDAVTMRLAVWWIGGSGTRVQRRRKGMGWETDRLIRLYGPVIRQLRELGASHKDVAAYLGAAEPTVGRAVARLESAAEAASQPSVELEMAA